jgi:hypothetical protein
MRSVTFPPKVMKGLVIHHIRSTRLLLCDRASLILSVSIFMTVDLVQDGVYGGHVTDIDDLVSVMREQLSDLHRVPTVVVSRFLEEFHWFTPSSTDQNAW